MIEKLNEDNVILVDKDQLLGEINKMNLGGYRFITATCADNGDETLDVYYHFDKDLKELKNIKLTVTRGEEVPSVSGIYFCAALVENEMKELFGINITNMALDYGGHLLLSDDDLDAPMRRSQIVIEKKGEK